jgi:hypothetical protein
MYANATTLQGAQTGQTSHGRRLNTQTRGNSGLTISSLVMRFGPEGEDGQHDGGDGPRGVEAQAQRQRHARPDLDDAAQVLTRQHPHLPHTPQGLRQHAHAYASRWGHAALVVRPWARDDFAVQLEAGGLNAALDLLWECLPGSSPRRAGR